MKNITRKLLLLVSAIFIFALTGCPDISLSQAGKEGGLKITISGDAKNSRTLLPNNPVFVQYVLSFESLDGHGSRNEITLGDGEHQVTAAQSTITINDLIEGQWRIHAKGFVIFNGIRVEAASGYDDVFVQAGTPTYANISISAQLTGPDGTFNYSIAYPNNKNVTVGSLVLSQAGGGVVKTINLMDSNAGSVSLAPGYYVMRVTLQNDYQTAGRAEIVHIYSNMTTEFDYAFDGNDFVDTITVSGSLTSRISLVDMTVFFLNAQSTEADYLYNEVGRFDITSSSLSSGEYSSNYSIKVPKTSNPLWLYLYYPVQDKLFLFKSITGNADITVENIWINFTTVEGTIYITEEDVAITDSLVVRIAGFGDSGPVTNGTSAGSPGTWSITGFSIGNFADIEVYRYGGSEYVKTWTNQNITMSVPLTHNIYDPYRTKKSADIDLNLDKSDVDGIYGVGTIDSSSYAALVNSKFSGIVDGNLKGSLLKVSIYNKNSPQWYGIGNIGGYNIDIPFGPTESGIIEIYIADLINDGVNIYANVRITGVELWEPQGTVYPGDLPYKAVTDIVGIPGEGFTGVPFKLNPTVKPINATNKTVTWTSNDGTFAWDFSSFTPTTNGWITITATIPYGETPSLDFVESYYVNVADPLPTFSIAGLEAAPTTITVDSSDISYVGDPTIVGITGGYRYIYGNDVYGDSIAKININLGSKKLSEFASVSFDFQAKGGDSGYKDFMLLADSLPASGTFTDYVVSDLVETGTNNFGSSAITLTINNDTVTQDLTGDIEIAIYSPMGATGSGAATVYEITNITFTPSGDPAWFTDAAGLDLAYFGNAGGIAYDGTDKVFTMDGSGTNAGGVIVVPITGNLVNSASLRIKYAALQDAAAAKVTLKKSSAVVDGDNWYEGSIVTDLGPDYNQYIDLGTSSVTTMTVNMSTFVAGTHQPNIYIQPNFYENTSAIFRMKIISVYCALHGEGNTCTCTAGGGDVTDGMVSIMRGADGLPYYVGESGSLGTDLQISTTASGISVTDIIKDYAGIAIQPQAGGGTAPAYVPPTAWTIGQKFVVRGTVDTLGDGGATSVDMVLQGDGGGYNVFVTDANKEVGDTFELIIEITASNITDITTDGNLVVRANGNGFVEGGGFTITGIWRLEDY